MAFVRNFQDDVAKLIRYRLPRCLAPAQVACCSPLFVNQTAMINHTASKSLQPFYTSKCFLRCNRGCTLSGLRQVSAHLLSRPPWQSSRSPLLVVNDGHSRFQKVWRRPYAAVNAGHAAAGKPVVQVITKRVDPDFKMEHEEWQRRMNQLVSEQPGFLSVQKQVSDEDETLKIVIISFESQEDMDRWIASDARKKMLDEIDGFHKLTSVQPMDTSAWGMVAVPAKPAPPVWKNTLVVFSALYPTITFTRIMIEPCFAILPFWSAVIPEVRALMLIAITCTIMNVFSMKTAFSVIGPRLFPPDTCARTALKVTALLGWTGLVFAVQVPDWRDAVINMIKGAVDT